MDCPKCPGKLEKKEFHSKDKFVEIDQCFGCQGVWLDEGELDKLREFRLTEFDLDSHINEFDVYQILNEKIGICPRCNKEMKQEEIQITTKTGFFSREKVNLKVDSCDSCKGLWVDGGEINYLTEITKSDVPAMSVWYAIASKYFRK